MEFQAIPRGGVRTQPGERGVDEFFFFAFLCEAVKIVGVVRTVADETEIGPRTSGFAHTFATKGSQTDEAFPIPGSQDKGRDAVSIGVPPRGDPFPGKKEGVGSALLEQQVPVAGEPLLHFFPALIEDNLHAGIPSTWQRCQSSAIRKSQSRSP